MSDERQVDRATWAALVEQWRRTIAGKNQTRLGEILGVTPRTISRWLKQEVNVSEENVRAAARAVGRRPMDLLVQVGYYAAEEVESASPRADTSGASGNIVDEIEFEISVVLRDETLSKSERNDLLKFMRELQSQQQAEEEALRTRHATERRRQLSVLTDMFRRGTKPAT